ncbi:MAG: DUF5915 domain-containing protein, partial [Methanoregulaceae archaeon]|nr:DUF5915 domain-containing protein [Methanoregulaceae archaeon]
EPQMKVLGPKFGKDAPKVRAAILEADGSSLKKVISDGIVLAGYQIEPSYVKFEEDLPQNVTSVATDLFKVYVDTTLTPELEAEGYAREVVRRFQEMRKKADLKVEDHIVAAAAIPDSRVRDLVTSWREGIMEEVRAVEMTITSDEGQEAGWLLTEEWEVEGVRMILSLSKAPDQ